MKRSNHAASKALFGLGAVLAFIGFVWPGWAWVLLTPGDVEMLPMAAITVVGLLGVVILIAGGFRRVYEKRE